MPRARSRRGSVEIIAATSMRFVQARERATKALFDSLASTYFIENWAASRAASARRSPLRLRYLAL